MNYVIYNRHGRLSLGPICEPLNVQLVRWWGGHWSPAEPTDVGIVIGWATQKGLPCQVRYNEPAAVALAADKMRCRQHLAAADVPVPVMTDAEFPCIGRPQRHWGGRRLWVCNTPDDVNRARDRGAAYFSKVYPKTQEWRVHIGSGMVLFVQRKIPPDGFTGIVWNHNLNGFTFNLVGWDDWPAKVIFAARKAVEAVGLDYGAVDVMAEPTDDQPPAVVTEINTGMEVTAPYNVGVYQNYFQWLLAQPAKQPWLMGDKKNPRSLSFVRYIRRIAEERVGEQ